MGCFAQFSAGTDGFFITQNTAVAIAGLTLVPSADLFLESRQLTSSATAIPGTPPSITRVYNFSQPIQFEGTVGLFYSDSELNDNPAVLLQLVYGTTSYVSTTGSTINTTTKYISNNLSSPVSFSSISAAQAGALPVTLIGFSVKRNENLTSLYWKTSRELNSDFFEVQQSDNGKKWNVLGSVKASLESSRDKEYDFQDLIPRQGMQYYRLKMVDVDGRFAYSGIRSLDLESTVQLTAYPNPVSDKLNISANTELTRLKVTDLSGRTLLEISKPKAGQELSLKTYPSGTYLLQLQTAQGRNEIIKILKN